MHLSETAPQTSDWTNVSSFSVETGDSIGPAIRYSGYQCVSAGFSEGLIRG